MQSTLSLSVEESDWYALVKGCAVGFGLQGLLKDWGVDIKVRIKTDSSAAIGIGNRRGLGKLRHVQTRYLWVQERIAHKDLTVAKVHTSVNFSDMLTKPMSGEELRKFSEMIGQYFHEGRSDTAKKLIGRK